MGEREGAILSQQILEFLHSSICLKPYLICGGWMVVVGSWCLFPILVVSFSKSWTIKDIILQLETFVVFCLIWNNLARPNPPLATEANSDLGLTLTFSVFRLYNVILFWSFSWDFQVFQKYLFTMTSCSELSGGTVSGRRSLGKVGFY